ncbi:unnamed protein product [Ectocarpus sp. 12 AP-2014]
MVHMQQGHSRDRQTSRLGHQRTQDQIPSTTTMTTLTNEYDQNDTETHFFRVTNTDENDQKHLPVHSETRCTRQLQIENKKTSEDSHSIVPVHTQMRKVYGPIPARRRCRRLR